MKTQRRPYRTPAAAVEAALDTARTDARIAAARRASAFGATSQPILTLAALKAIPNRTQRAVCWLELDRPNQAALAMEALSDSDLFYERCDIDAYIAEADSRALALVAAVYVTLDDLDAIIDQARSDVSATRWQGRLEDAYAVACEYALNDRPFWRDRDGGLWVESDDVVGQYYRANSHCTCHAGQLAHPVACWHRCLAERLVERVLARRVVERAIAAARAVRPVVVPQLRAVTVPKSERLQAARAAMLECYA